MSVVYALIGIFVVCPLLWALLEAPFSGPKPARPAPRPRPVPPGDYLCLGTGFGIEGMHTHKDGADVDRCNTGLPPVVPVGKRPAACPRCNRNHFEEKCPGYRVTDSRTGEVVGYWRPKDA